MRAFALPFVLLAGCWSLTTETGDLSSGVASADGGARGDASAGDGAPLGEGGSDAPATPFCATHGGGALDCVDFDGVGSAIADYGFSQHVTSSGTVALDTLSLSPPRSFLSQMPATHADCAYAAIEKTYPAATHYRVSFAFRVDPASDPSAIGFPAVVGVNLPGGVTEQLFFLTGTTSVEPYGQYQTVDSTGSKTDSFHFPSKGKIGEWSHAAFEMDFRTPASGKITIDGDTIPFPMTRFPAAMLDQAHALFIALGWHCHDANFKGIAVHIDDVLVETLP